MSGWVCFADGLGRLVDLEIFEHVNAEFAGGGEVHVAVVIEVGGDELRADAGGAVDGERDAGEERGRRRGSAIAMLAPEAACGLPVWALAVANCAAVGRLIGVDDDGIVGAGVAAGVAAVALAGDELGCAVAVEIDECEGVRLREGFVDGVADPVRCAGVPACSSQ